MNCKICGSELKKENYTPRQWSYKNCSFKNKGYVFCSKECSSEYCRKVSSETMRKTNLKYASERMKRNNPTRSAEVRAKISKSKKGQAPVIRGGNGTGLTKPQEMLLIALSEFSPIPEYSITTHKKKGSGFPQSYKPDIAIPQYKISIDIDGNSHHSHVRKGQDRKKDDVLRNLGWKVFRFWNLDVLNNLDFCTDIIKTEIERRDQKCG